MKQLHAKNINVRVRIKINIKFIPCKSQESLQGMLGSSNLSSHSHTQNIASQILEMSHIQPC
jgi:hypothetical protein